MADIEQLREKAPPAIVAAHDRLNAVTDPNDLPTAVAVVDAARGGMADFRKLDRNMRNLTIRTFEAQLARLHALAPQPGQEDRKRANVGTVELFVADLRTANAEQSGSPAELARDGAVGAGNLAQRGGSAALDVSQGIVSNSGKALTWLGENRWLSLAAVSGAVFAASRWIRQKMRGAYNVAYGGVAYGVSSLAGVPRRISNWRNARRSRAATSPAETEEERITRLSRELESARSARVATSGYAG